MINKGFIMNPKKVITLVMVGNVHIGALMKMHKKLKVLVLSYEVEQEHLYARYPCMCAHCVWPSCTSTFRHKPWQLLHIDLRALRFFC